MKLPRAEFFKHPCPPAWRDAKVSTKCHAACCSIKWRAGNVVVHCNSQWQHCGQLNLMPGLIDRPNHDMNIPLLAQRPRLRIDFLPYLGWTIRNDGPRLRIPPGCVTSRI